MDTYQLASHLEKIPYPFRQAEIQRLLKAEADKKPDIHPAILALNASERAWIIGHLKAGIKNMIKTAHTENLGRYRNCVRLLESLG